MSHFLLISKRESSPTSTSCNMVGELVSTILFLLAELQTNVVALIKYLLFFRVPHWRLPPGPLANFLPFFGSLPLFAIAPSHLMLTKISEKYEKIYRLRFGKTTYIVICDHVLLKETFAKEVVCGRNMPPMMEVMDHQGLVHAEGEFWKTQRFFIHQVLKELGLPRTEDLKAFDKKAYQAIGTLLDELKTTNGNPVNLDEPLCVTITNIFFSMIVGKTFDRNDIKLLSIIESSHAVFRATEPISFANFIPFIAGLPINKKLLDDVETSKERFNDYMQPIIEDHRQKLDPGNPRNLIDAFLIQIINGKHSFTESQLHALLGDVFTASLESTAAAIHWILLALVTFPEIQKRAYEQMCKVTNNERAPTLDDRSSLTYLEATILEGYRFSSILPYGVPHATTQDTSIDGYHIPKNTTVIGLFWKFNRDKKLWQNPDNFDPSNHLDGDKLLNNPYLMPFSVGKRMCLSETVANDEIFLIVANLLHTFMILPSDGEAPTQSMDESLEGLLRVPRHFRLKLVTRESVQQPSNDS